MAAKHLAQDKPNEVIRSITNAVESERIIMNDDIAKEYLRAINTLGALDRIDIQWKV